jgi:hypothetical protein
MSNVQMPNVIIKPKDQSAPKEHPAQAEIRKAAVEIDEGRWIPDPRADETAIDDLGLALRTGPESELRQRPTLQDFQDTRTLNELGRHPRVIEAMEKMAKEVEETTNPQEALEKTWALHEMAVLQAADQKWEGQERWEGKENEEMRHGQLLTPPQFYDRLGKVVGKGRIKLSMNVVKTNPEAKSGRVGLYIKNPEWQGEKPKVDYPQVRAKAIREEAEMLMAKAKRLRKLRLDSEADKVFDLAGGMIQEATKILMEMSAAEQLAPSEYLRVGTLQWPVGTEWMVMNFNEFGVPTTAKYLGWRTALLTMIRCGALTEANAHKAFPVGSGPAASWYLEQLMKMRNVAGSVQ